MIHQVIYIFIPVLISLMLCSCTGSTNQQFGESVKAKDATALREHAEPRPDYSTIEHWKPGFVVDSAIVYGYGYEKCFYADTLSDSLFNLMKGTSYHSDTPVGRKELRYLRILHYNSEGEIIMGEMVCNQAIASDLLEIFSELFKARYPIERMNLACRYGGDDEVSMTDNNTSCFNSRKINGSSRPSRHAFGLAVDINPLYNPYIKVKNGVVVKILPVASKSSDPHSPYHIDKGDLCYRMFIAHGFQWGGSWHSVKDYQHFEKR